jgi:WD40 repeat protein
LASGSWNGDCKIWKQGTDQNFQEVAVLGEHSYAVQCLFLTSGNLITSSQDGNLNLFNSSGKMLKQYPNAHSDIVRKIKELSFGEMSHQTGHYFTSIPSINL